MKTSQTQRLIDLLKDGKEHSTVEIMDKVYGGDHLGLARVGARIFDAKKKGYNITGRRDQKKASIYWYKMIFPSSQSSIFERVKYTVQDKIKNTNWRNWL